jgi:hypothetical protein
MIREKKKKKRVCKLSKFFAHDSTVHIRRYHVLSRDSSIFRDDLHARGNHATVTYPVRV